MAQAGQSRALLSKKHIKDDLIEAVKRANEEYRTILENEPKSKKEERCQHVHL